MLHCFAILQLTIPLFSSALWYMRDGLLLQAKLQRYRPNDSVSIFSRLGISIKSFTLVSAHISPSAIRLP